MSVQFQFERVENPREQADIESAVRVGLGGTAGQWKVTVVGFLSTRAYLLDVVGPCARWREFCPIHPEMLSDISNHMKRLAALNIGLRLSESHFTLNSEQSSLVSKGFSNMFSENGR
ncbi:MAG TPA: hypothetical protein VEZ90_00760 [Blastocatellia bacterium]|nr:hypothetical protein [Blastocatellia bacterium]